MREEDEVAEELTERIGFTMKETKKEDEYHAKVMTNFYLNCFVCNYPVQPSTLPWRRLFLGADQSCNM